MTPSHLGIDVSKAKPDCALRLPGGKFRAKVVANPPEGFDALLAWLDSQQAGQPHARMEATGVYWEAAAQFLVAQGFMVSVINPVQIKSGSGYHTN